MRLPLFLLLLFCISCRSTYERAEVAYAQVSNHRPVLISQLVDFGSIIEVELLDGENTPEVRVVEVSSADISSVRIVSFEDMKSPPVWSDKVPFCVVQYFSPMGGENIVSVGFADKSSCKLFFVNHLDGIEEVAEFLDGHPIFRGALMAMQ